MMEYRLRNQLGRLEAGPRQARLWRQLRDGWLAAAGIETLILLTTPWSRTPLWLLPPIAAVVAAVFLWRRQRRRPADFRALLKVIVRENPEVRALLPTAAEQEPDPATGEFNYLQLRVIEEALAHPRAVHWERQLARKTAAARNAQWLALAVMLAVFYFGHHLNARHLRMMAGLPFLGSGMVVTPGDTQLERGSGLVITARIDPPPAEAVLILVSASGKTQRLPMARNLADPVFGVSLLEVTDSGLYRVEYSGKKTRDFKISVFDYPALARADANLQFPAYTGMTNKTIRDTRRISAVEGTRLDYTLQLNKPVTRARLVAIGKGANALALALETNAVARLNNFILTNNAHLALELIDAEGRTNKVPAEFVFQALPNRPPEVKIAFPKGDQRVSALEEMQLQGEASDDFGLLKYGMGFGVPGREPELIELGQSAPANEKRQFTQPISLEKLGVEPDQLVSYFAWAEDYGPDGQVRRTFSDIFFAEVRPFDEIFRADQSGASESQQSGQPGQGENEGPQLAELQKQIVIATWKLQRTQADAPKGNRHEN